MRGLAEICSSTTATYGCDGFMSTVHPQSPVAPGLNPNKLKNLPCTCILFWPLVKRNYSIAHIFKISFWVLFLSIPLWSESTSRSKQVLLRWKRLTRATNIFEEKNRFSCLSVWLKTYVHNSLVFLFNQLH